MNLLVERRRIKRNAELIAKSILFDKEFYSDQYKLSPRANAARHYCAIGWRRNYNPSRFFNTEFYLGKYDDVRRLKVNPLVHYLTDGASELRVPSRNFDVNTFVKLHADRLGPEVNPAERCIEWYGDYDWQNRYSNQFDIAPKVVVEFRKYFNEAFYRSMNPDVAESGMDPYQHFIQHGQYEDRDPAPEFDIYNYKRKIEKNLPPYTNPVIHKVEIAPNETWPSAAKDDVLISPATSKIPPDRKLSVCVHAHCFYPELIAEMIPKFRFFSSAAMIVVTVVSEADAGFVRQVLLNEPIPAKHEIRIVPNRGRDLGPFIVGCRDLWSTYDIVLHIHTKRSPHLSWGDDWRKYLLDQTMGSAPLIDAIVDKFESETDLGCLYPRNFAFIRRYIANEANSRVINAVLDRLGHQNFVWQGADFPAGSMAWYRTEPLRPLVEAFGHLEYLEEEEGQLDGTFAHALERILPISVRATGYRVASYITPYRAQSGVVVGMPQREDPRADVTKRWSRDTPAIAQRAPEPLRSLSQVFDAAALDIHWIVPSFIRGAGGHMTIFRIVELLEEFGHFQTIWLQNAYEFADQAAAKKAIQEWFRPVGDRVHVRFLPEDVRELSGDVLIATDCWTAFPAAETVNFKERFYFVQDFEPSFHPSGELQLLAESTYDFGFPTLCAGAWLRDLMEKRGNWSRQWDLCADHEVYFPGVPAIADGGPIRIVFYARSYTPRRAVKLGLAAFGELHRRGVNFHVELFGQSDVDVEYMFPHTQHGVLSPSELSELYRKSDLGVVFSTTNYSLIPLEMMACKLPVIEIEGASTRAIFKNGEVSFAKPLPYEIANAIESLMHDSERQRIQQERASQFVNGTSWTNSARAIEHAFLDRLTERGFKKLTDVDIAAPVLHKRRKATIFIPTFNPGPAFENVLEALVRQECDFNYDVFIIDSSSTDGTLELIRKFSEHSVRADTIDKADFQHGRTRNRGIAESDGEFVAIITQDACPKDDRWLSNLIGGFDAGPRVAGVIGRHEAYPNHSAFVQRDINETFDNIRYLPPIIDRNISMPSYIYPGGRSWRMLRQFYSDNNSAVARSAWNALPYPEIDWGEDQVWADEIIRLGFQKSYVDHAIVYHSHDFDAKEQYTVALAEGKFWGQQYGYNLHPDPKASIAGMDARDEDFALQNGISSSVLTKRKLLNRATVEGRDAGYRSSRRPR